MKLRPPFPWFGGKSRVAHLVWPRFGNVPNYVEPFAGTLAVLLARPHAPRVETVNDKDCFIANFWRAVQADPEAVAHHADWPVNETDLHARHRWLVETGRARVERTMTDPDYFDAKLAGWWVWGQCLWIGSGWCASNTRRCRQRDPSNQKRRPQHANGTDVDRTVEWQPRPDLSAANGRGAVLTSTTPHRKMPQASRGRRGYGGPAIEEEFGDLPRKRPNACGNGQGCGVHRRWQGGGQGGGSGVHAPSLSRQVPQLSGDGSGAQRGCLSNGTAGRRGGLYAYIAALAARLRRVRVCSGDWTRIMSPAVTSYVGLTGVFLDPPYAHSEREICYAQDEDVGAAVRAWALANGDNPLLRVALCGYEGEHKMPDSWECIGWRAHGGYSRTARGKANRGRERIWLSPHCLPADLPLMAESEAGACSS